MWQGHHSIGRPSPDFDSDNGTSRFLEPGLQGVYPTIILFLFSAIPVLDHLYVVDAHATAFCSSRSLGHLT